MSTSNEFLDYCVEMLESLGDINVSRMFGGALLKVGGRQLGVVIDDTLFFKVIDPELQQRYKQSGSHQFSYTRKDKKAPIVIKNWWSVPEDTLDSSERLVELAEEVLAQQVAE